MHLSSTRTGYELMRIIYPNKVFPLKILGANITTSIQRLPVLCDLFSELPSMVAIDKFDCISWQSVLLVEETGGLGENHRTAASH